MLDRNFFLYDVSFEDYLDRESITALLTDVFSGHNILYEETDAFSNNMLAPQGISITCDDVASNSNPQPFQSLSIHIHGNIHFVSLARQP